MALNTMGRVAMGVVVLGLAAVIAGFACLLVALHVPGLNFTAFIIAGSVAAGVGFIAAMIAALYLTITPETGFDLLDPIKKKIKPSLVTAPEKSEDPKTTIPPLSNVSKDHIYRMTLNLGSIDVRSDSLRSQSTQNLVEEQSLVEADGGNEYVESPTLQPGLMDGTKQFKD